MAINISGILKTPQGSAIQNAEIIFEQTRTSTEVLAGTKFSVITNQTGNYSSSLGVGTYVFKVRFQDETQYRTVASNVIVTQSMNNYSLNQIIQDQSQLQDVDYDLLQDVIQARDQAAASAQAAQTSQATATTKASEASSSAQAALASKNAAQTSEANALSSKNAAQTSQTNAANSQTAAQSSQTTASTEATEASNSAQAALSSKNAAATSEANALASKNAAQASQTTASTKAGEASQSQTTASTKADEAAASQTQAQSSQTDSDAAAQAASTSEANALASKNQAQTSQATATTKASEASSSAQAALASKNALATSETNALASKNQAQTSQTNASNSQTAAAASQTTASTKAGEASTSQTNAAASQATASTKASEASTSQTNAAASQTTATTKAGEASTSQTNAAASQATATTKATEAANSTTLAQKWAANPENSAVSGGLYSALHYAAKAAQSAQTASGQLVWRGGWSAQVGSAPPTPSGATQDFYRITQAGTILSVQYEVGDYIHWDNLNSIWFKMDGTDSVISVNGRTGAVVIAKADVGLSLVNNWGASSQTNDASTTTYATTAGVKAAYDLAATKLTATANAVSATKLVTARTINGTNFDGTANITTQNWGTSRNLTIGDTAKAVNGSANVSWTLAEIGAVNKTGDTMTGDLTATKVLVSGAQGTEVNALTRRDYVDEELAKKLNLTGGTLTGNLTAPAVLVSAAQNTSVNALTRKDYVDSATALKVNKAGDTMTGGLTFVNADCELGWVFNTDCAKIGFKNTADGDTDSYMWFKTWDNGNEYFKWQSVSGANTTDWMSLKSTGLVVAAGVTAPTFTGALAGNAATATKLATARQINGTNFDGSDNITTANWGTARTLTIGNAAKSVNGAGNVSWSLAEIGALPVTGGTVSGALGVTSELYLVGLSASDMADIVWKAPDGTERGRLWIGGTAGADNSLTWRSGASGATHKIYHEGNKPTAAEVGAAPAGFGLGGYGTGISSVLGDTSLRRKSGFFQGSYIEGLPTSPHPWNYVFNQAHWNPAGYFGYLAINFNCSRAWIGGQEGGAQKGPFELVKQGDRFVAMGAVGNDYNQCAVEVNGNTAIDSRPGIGFHMAGRFASTLHLWEGGDFRFHTQGVTSYAGIMTGNVNANDVYIRSDIRLKRNLVRVTGALRKVSSLTAYSYDKKQTLEATEYDKKEVGLIAQEVEQVLPEAVTRVVDSSNKDGTEILTLSNSALIALLVGAVKELSEKVKELEYGRT